MEAQEHVVCARNKRQEACKAQSKQQVRRKREGGYRQGFALGLVHVIDIDGEVAVQVLHSPGDVLDQLVHHGHAHVLPDHSPQQLGLPADRTGGVKGFRTRGVKTRDKGFEGVYTSDKGVSLLK